jgi:hypothetical protein
VTNYWTITVITPFHFPSISSMDEHMSCKLHFNTGDSFFPMARQPLGGLCHLIFRGFTITQFLDTPHSVGLLWARDQLVAETSTWKHTTLTRDRHPWPRRDSNPNPSKRAASDPRLDHAATGIGYRILSWFKILDENLAHFLNSVIYRDYSGSQNFLFSDRGKTAADFGGTHNGVSAHYFALI